MNAPFVVHNVRRQIEAHPKMVVATTVAFCLLALVGGGARLGARTVERWATFVGQNVHLIVYLAEEVGEEQALGLRDILRRTPTVAQVTVVEPEQALARLTAAAAAFHSEGKALEGLEPSYFPRSLEVSLTPTPDIANRASGLAGRLRQVPGVAEVDAMTTGLDRLSVWVKVGRTLGVVVLVALGLVGLLGLMSVFWRGRDAMARRAAVLAQLGETPAGIRLPSGLWVALAALVGGGTGAGILALAWRPLLHRLESSLGIASALPSPPLALAEITAGLLVMIAAGCALGYFTTPLPASSDHA